MTRGRKILWTLGIVVAVLVAARIALPYIVKDYTNRKLAGLDSYYGHVEDIDVHLWRGAYSIDDIVIEKTAAKRHVPFFRTARLDLSIEWRSLLHGRLVSKARFTDPELNLVQGPTEESSQLGKEEDWHARLEELFPFEFNTVEVTGGTVRFLAPGIETRDAITARHVHGRISNITNVVDPGKETFAAFRLEGDVLDGAPAVVAGSVDPFAKTPTFDVNMEVKKIELPKANPWLRQYIKADAESGKFELYVEMAAADNKFVGYAKPILEDVDIYRSGEPEKNPLKRVWEGFLDFAADVFENKDAQQVAARIPFKGTLENPKTSLFATIASVMRNAFVSAFARSLEGSITLRDVKKNLSSIDPAPPGDKAKKKDKDDKEKPDESTPRGPPGKS